MIMDARMMSTIKTNDRVAITITDVKALDIRFPTSRTLDGSDAMNPDPDYSAAYVILNTDSELVGHGLTFTIGRGNDVCCSVIRQLGSLLIGKTLQSLTEDLAGFWYLMTGDSQFRWLGRKKGWFTSLLRQ